MLLLCCTKPFYNYTTKLFCNYITIPYVTLPGRISGARAGFRTDSGRESLKIDPPAGLPPPGGSILCFSPVASGRKPARKQDFRPGSTIAQHRVLSLSLFIYICLSRSLASVALSVLHLLVLSRALFPWVSGCLRHRYLFCCCYIAFILSRILPNTVFCLSVVSKSISSSSVFLCTCFTRKGKLHQAREIKSQMQTRTAGD